MSPLFRADWRSFSFAHYSVAPESLAPYTPFPLDCHRGRAFVSLVFFRLERMRPARWLPPALGRALLRPVSDHWFLNVRTYVTGPAGPGIQFLTEWVDNPLSRWLGPLTYGLPYRLGRFVQTPRTNPGEDRFLMEDRRTGESLALSFRAASTPPAQEVERQGTFCLERYTAYTVTDGKQRWFHIAHPRWAPAAARVEHARYTLLRRLHPWFAEARFESAHWADGFANVAMGPPHRHRAGMRSCSELQPSAAISAARSGY